MTESVKVVDFKNNLHLLHKMPVYVKNKNIKWVILLFSVLVIFGLIVYSYAGIDTAHDQFAVAVGFIAICFFIVLLLVFYSVKGGAFVLAADEKGIYYRILGWKDDFMFIEWRAINKIASAFFDESHRLEVSTLIKSDALPAACNAVISRSRTTKNITISFVMSHSKQSTETKQRLDELRIKSQSSLLA